MNLNRLKWYSNTIMTRDLLYKTVSPSSKGNIFTLPKIINLSLNMGSNGLSTAQNTSGPKRKMVHILSGLELLSCQKVKRTYAKKSIASFKLRKGQCIGGMVTLRDDNMFFFLEKFCFIVTPKIREFQGLQGPKIQGERSEALADLSSSGLTARNKKTKAFYSIDFSGAPFLLYPELSNQYETFEGVQGFNVSIRTQKATKSMKNLLISFFIP